MHYLAPLEGLFESSRLMILDFSEIPPRLRPEENIRQYFEDCSSRGINPRLPEHRQAFNDHMLEACNVRYLVSRYGEDRRAMLVGSQIAAEGRTIHMGIDIFSRDLEPVFAPCDGEIVLTGVEPEPHSYGNYLAFRPTGQRNLYFFMGHLSRELPALGPVNAGQQIAQLGDYHNNENGGWSRHLHLQVIRELPAPGTTPDGYSTRERFDASNTAFPDPMPLFPNWQISRP